MEKAVDMTLTCHQCGKEFVFPKSEQEFYKEKGFALPRRCRECRANKRSQIFQPEAKKLTSASDESAAKLSAAESGRAQIVDVLNTKLNTLESEKALLVNEFNARLSAVESEKQNLLKQAETKLSAIDSDNTKLAKLLQEEKQLTATLQEQLNSVNIELEKSLKYRAALDWLEPTSKILRERLEALERTQNSLNQTMLQLIQNITETHEDVGLLEVLRRIIQSRRNKVRKLRA